MEIPSGLNFIACDVDHKNIPPLPAPPSSCWNLQCVFKIPFKGKKLLIPVDPLPRGFVSCQECVSGAMTLTDFM